MENRIESSSSLIGRVRHSRREARSPMGQGAVDAPPGGGGGVVHEPCRDTGMEGKWDFSSGLRRWLPSNIENTTKTRLTRSDKKKNPKKRFIG